MTQHTKGLAGYGLVIVGGALISFGASLTWGLTGAFIAGGIYSALCGAVMIDSSSD